MNKKILISLCVIVAVAIVGIGATRALFSDTETSTGNTISAGTLDLAVNGENPVSSFFTLSDVYPGYDQSYDVTFSNEGTIDASNLYLSVSNLVDDEGANPEPETDTVAPGDLSGAVDIEIKDGATSLWSGTLSALAALPPHSIVLGALTAGTSKVITLRASVATSVENEIMGDIATFNIVGELVQ